MGIYRYYLIDIDRTLWDFDRNSKSAVRWLVDTCPRLLEAARACYGEDYQDRYYEMYDRYNREMWRAYERGLLSKDLLRWKRFHRSFLEVGIDDEAFARKFSEDYLERMLHEKALMPGAKQLLQDIQADGGKMAVLSNGFKEIQYRKLERSGIRDFFDVVAISEEIGWHKPSPEFFRAALERLSGVSAADKEAWKSVKRKAIVIGDDIENDIEGGQIFGIDQYFYNPGGKPSPGATYESPHLIFSIMNTSSPSSWK